MTRSPAPRSARAVSLIEAVICVVVLALAVPPCMELMSVSASDRADAVNTTRAAAFAELVIETCLADVASDDPALGFAALSDPAAYSDALAARVEAISQPYADLGMAYQLAVGDLVDRTAQTNADPGENVFRVLTVTVTFPTARGADRSMPVSILVGNL